MKQLSPELFIFDKYCGRMGIPVTEIFEDAYSDITPKLAPGVVAIGYCDASRLRVRPRTDGYAIMVDINGEETWCHSSNLFV